MNIIKRINFNKICKVKISENKEINIKLLNDDNLSFSPYSPSHDCIAFSEIILDENFNPVLPNNGIFVNFTNTLLENKGGYYLLVEKTDIGVYFSYYPIYNIERYQSDIITAKISINLKKGYKYGFENGTGVNLSKLDCDDNIKMYFDILRHVLDYKIYGKEYMLSKLTNIVYGNNMDYTNKLIEFKSHPYEIRAVNTYDTIYISNDKKCIWDDMLYVNGYLVNMIQSDDFLLSIKINMGYGDLCITKEYAHYNQKASEKAEVMIEFEPCDKIRDIMINFYKGKQLKK